MGQPGNGVQALADLLLVAYLYFRVICEGGQATGGVTKPTPRQYTNDCT